MQSISRDFYNKIAREGGILDTSNYRYVIKSPDQVERIRIEYIGTTEALRQNGNWVSVAIRR